MLQLSFNYHLNLTITTFRDKTILDNTPSPGASSNTAKISNNEQREITHDSSKNSLLIEMGRKLPNEFRYQLSWPYSTHAPFA